MFFQLIAATLAGIFFGIITGLTPGVHINLVSLILLNSAPFLIKYLNIFSLIVFIISMSVTHTFLDAIPSIFLGAPDSSQALGVLPGHRYLLKGQGFMAVKLTVIGSYGAILMSVLMLPLTIPFIYSAYPKIEPFIGYILIIAVIFMIMRDRLKIWALMIFLMSGVFGLITFQLGMKDPLFPMLSGLFGISTLLISINDKNNIPEQKISEETKIRKSKAVKSLLSGQFSGFLTSMFPGLGSAQAAIISMQITPDLGDHGFMVLVGAINTANFTMSMATLYALGRARNGSIAAISQMMDSFGIKEILLFMSIALIAGSLSVFLTLKIGKIFSNMISRINYRALVISIISLIVLLTVVLAGWTGLIVLIASTAIGLVPAIVKTSRTHAMGCLLVPVILYFVL